MNELAANQSNDIVSSTDMPWQVIQEFYHHIVGSKETLSKRFNKPYEIRLSDIEDLHQRITHVAGTYSLETSSLKIIINYIDKKSLSVPSFEQFKVLCSSGTQATKGVELEYNFLIKHSETSKPNNYKVSVDLISGVAVFSEIHDEIPKFLLKSIGYITGMSKVEFVDYGIGQNFVNVVSDWFDARTIAKSNKLFDWVQKKSDQIPLILRYISVAVCAYLSVKLADNYLVSGENDVALSRFLIVSLSTIYIFSMIGYKIGSWIEKAVDGIEKITFVQLNEGDKKLINSTKQKNKDCWLSIFFRAVVFFAYSLIPALIINSLGF